MPIVSTSSKERRKTQNRVAKRKSRANKKTADLKAQGDGRDADVGQEATASLTGPKVASPHAKYIAPTDSMLQDSSMVSATDAGWYAQIHTALTQRPDDRYVAETTAETIGSSDSSYSIDPNARVTPGLHDDCSQVILSLNHPQLLSPASGSSDSSCSMDPHTTTTTTTVTPNLRDDCPQILLSLNRPQLLSPESMDSWARDTSMAIASPALYPQQDTLADHPTETSNLNLSGYYKPVQGSPLHIAAAMGHVSVAKTLIAHGADLDGVDRMGLTPLHYVVLNNQSAILLLLLDQGAAVNYQDPDGCTPLYRAAEKGNNMIVETLIQHGAQLQ